ncbi:SOS response-associated peptidase family protein [Pseudoalteromonas luteoviolacea]|uniref:Abasic site processing protein n=1 Tax=Pseudoalteromonas luteoviolacea S4054 TaxID=1129367 RepID=A0A0F6A7B0_9GAMM|nr:SOS response-associated peptidase family protein [Pseudoalteromonas luteoviolacea]AOT09316.1 hypothetical protein S4054249_16325 [Pseudoalteromonas luteoviolacea]AOT14228.1 hypothetical protein S40542_16295 [Pseudoalteromonas luteoviolacea]AOT19144.1 hypothetical protein S4054_16300 [Pseudoalteromonas luteoviolacea]KKE82112.1 hypothetical protein N479_19955 [Pseudoalteromonas luteoviolacea S4054]KZN73420.1 hypothetical protein N481_11890 [Pseudoalteromonas luteoviolacea S4047-1]
MCGRLNITDDPFVIQILLDLGIENPIEKVQFSRFKRATDKISIIYQENNQRLLTDAIWWLLLSETTTGFKPSKYTSFNSRYDKLNVKSSAAYHPYRYQRCIVVAKGFGETQNNKGKPQHYHDFKAHNAALCFAGLYKKWLHPITGKYTFSCSIITLPPHPKLKPFHDKASPLVLPQQPELLNKWLDDSYHEVSAFSPLLTPSLPQTLIAQQIDKPSLYNPVSEEIVIEHDL